VILYTMLVGRPPYESRDVKSTYRRILANVYSFPDNINISDNAKSLIRRMLQVFTCLHYTYLISCHIHCNACSRVKASTRCALFHCSMSHWQKHFAKQTAAAVVTLT
jgi:serine/threonine protein kinase